MIFESYMWNLRKRLDNYTLSEEFLNQKCIVTTYFHQYAPGIYGTREAVHAYLKPDGTGWPYDAAAYKAAKDAGLKNHITRGKNEGYGEVGLKEFKRTVMSVRDAILYQDTIFGQITKFEPLPAAV